MLTLDARTLLVVGFFSYTLMGCLTLVAGVIAQRNRSLLWCACVCVLGGAAYLIGPAPGSHYWGEQAIGLSNIGLITAYACLWTGFRVGSLRIWSRSRDRLSKCHLRGVDQNTPCGVSSSSIDATRRINVASSVGLSTT